MCLGDVNRTMKIIFLDNVPFKIPDYKTIVIAKIDYDWSIKNCQGFTITRQEGYLHMAVMILRDQSYVESWLHTSP